MEKEIKPMKITGAICSVYALMPKMDDIPDDFKKFPPTNKWTEIISEWFYRGLPRKTEFHIKEGIDAETALLHIREILQSFEPQHEHKTAACAYLMSLWFDDVVNYKKYGD